MLNLLSSELYKLKKSKSFKVCLIASLCMIVYIFVMFGMIMAISTGSMENGTAGIMVTTQGTEDIADELFNSILDVISQIYSMGFGTIFVAIFICIWVISEYSNGAIKNVTGKGYTRKQVFLAKYLSTNLATCIMHISCLIVTTLGALILDRNGVNAQFFQNLFLYAALQILFGIALTGIIIAICEISRNIAAGISISLAIVIFSNVIVQGIDLFFETLHINFKTSTYWITNVISECPIIDCTMDFIGRGIYVAMMWIALSFVLGMVHFERTDIK